MAAPSEIRVLVADDHPTIRRGMVSVINTCPGFRVVAEAGSADEVVAAVASESPRVAVIDLGMPGVRGVELVQRLRGRHPELAILVFSQHREEDMGIACLKAGATGYLNKSAPVDEIVLALRTVAEGRRYISPALAEALVDVAPLADDRPPHESLSERELEVLHGLARGRRLGEIAADLGINAKTVHTYRTRVLSKLGVRSTVDIVLYAAEHRLLDFSRDRANGDDR